MDRNVSLSIIAALVVLGCGFSLNAQAAYTTPVGSWIQVGDKSQQPESLIQIWEQDKVLYGKVIKGFEVNHQPPEKLCSHCFGALHDMPIEGMTILWGFTPVREGVWGDGRILDPHTGDIYHCRLMLKEHGHQLDVRGYIGISLLGRSQEWTRQSG